MSFTIQAAAPFIPQRPPFVFVDKLLFVNENRSVCSFLIPEENFFVKDGYFSASGMVESMAQTAAAGTGFLAGQENKPVPLGYIGAVQKLEIFDWPPAKAEITMEVKRITNVLQVSLVSGLVKQGDRILASCEMKIFINNLS